MSVGSPSLHATSTATPRPREGGAGLHVRHESFHAPSEASALNDRQPLCWVPARPPKAGGPNPAVDLSFGAEADPATKKAPAKELKAQNPLRQLTPAESTLVTKPSNVMEYVEGKAEYRNVQVTKDLMKVVLIKRQDQAKFEAHMADPKRPFNLVDRAVILVDITSFKTGGENIPKDVMQGLQKQKEYSDYVCKLDYTSFDDGRPASRHFAFFDKNEFQQWTKAFRRVLQMAIQFYQINPNPVGVSRLWILSGSGEGNVTKDEMAFLLDHHAQIKMKDTVFQRLFGIIDDSRQGFIDRFGFESMWSMLMKSEAADRLWKKYTGNIDSVVMTPEQFMAFLKEEQSEEHITREEARLRMFSMYYVTKQYKSGKDEPRVFDKEMFNTYVTQSSLNYVGDERSIVNVAQPMDQPLSQYFIHAVNLTSVDEEHADRQPFYKRLEVQHMVEYCLEIGVRCLCLKLQASLDSKRKVVFDLIADGIPKRMTLTRFFSTTKDKAFAFSHFPLWLNFQICSLTEEHIRALVDELQDKWRFEYVKDLDPSHSPADLKDKYLILFTCFRERELSKEILRVMRGVSCFDVIRASHIPLQFGAVIGEAQKCQVARRRQQQRDLDDDDDGSSTATSRSSKRTQQDPGNLVALDPIPDVLLDAATYTTAYPWMNPQLEPELYDGPVLENLYDPRAKRAQYQSRPNRLPFAPLNTLRAVAAIMLTRSANKYEAGDPPSIRFPYSQFGTRLGGGEQDVSAKVHKLFFRNKDMDDEVPKEYDTARYPPSMLTRLLSHGIQLVEYNPFNPTLDRQIAMAWFSCNRSCGYVLKPWSFRLPDPKHMDRLHPYNENFVPPAKDGEEVKPLPDGPVTPREPPPPEDKATSSAPTDDTPSQHAIGDDSAFDRRERCGNGTLYVKVISGANLLLLADESKKARGIQQVKEKVAKRTSGSAPTNPYVLVRIDGHDEDYKVQHTEVVTGNGISPLWNAMFEFEVQHRECAVLSFFVYHDEGTHAPGAIDSFIGGFSIPVTLLKKGHRVIPLADQWGCRITTCPTLLCRIDEVPAGNLLSVSANINKIKKRIATQKQSLDDRRRDLLKEMEALRQQSLETQKHQQEHDELLHIKDDMESRYCHFGASEGGGCTVV
eukprot:EG_transcript_938